MSPLLTCQQRQAVRYLLSPILDYLFDLLQLDSCYCKLTNEAFWEKVDITCFFILSIRQCDDKSNSDSRQWGTHFKVIIILYVKEPRIDSKEYIPPAYAACAGILEQSVGPRNQVGIGFSCRPARLHTVYMYVGGIDSLESISGLHRSLKIPPLAGLYGSLIPIRFLVPILKVQHFAVQYLNNFILSRIPSPLSPIPKSLSLPTSLPLIPPSHTHTHTHNGFSNRCWEDALGGPLVYIMAYKGRNTNSQVLKHKYIRYFNTHIINFSEIEYKYSSDLYTKANKCSRYTQFSEILTGRNTYK